ncbi:MAG: hypothetical protein ACLQIS_02495 [Bryobacteraceae bacterium]
MVIFACGTAAASGALTLVHFPWNANRAGSSNLGGSSRLFYEHASWTSRAKIGHLAAKANPPAKSPQSAPVSEFVRRYGLPGKPVLEIGAGALQDVVEHDIGLDIAESAGTSFQEPFVQGSVADLPSQLRIPNEPGHRG